MGKTSRPFPVGQFRLYNTKRVKADKPRPIQIQFSINSVAVRRNTGYSAMEADWNPAENKGRGGVKASYGRDYRLVNARLMDMAKKTEEALAAYCEFNGHRLTAGVIRSTSAQVSTPNCFSVSLTLSTMTFSETFRVQLVL